MIKKGTTFENRSPSASPPAGSQEQNKLTNRTRQNKTTGRIVSGMLHSRSKTEATKEKLLDEGVCIFIERGYHGTGIKEVLDSVNVPKGSFYNYFKSKEEFGAEIIRHFAAQLEKQL